MAVTKNLASLKLSVSLKDSAGDSLGSQSISNCNPSGTLDGFLTAGKAIIALTGASDGEIKRVSNYALSE